MLATGQIDPRLWGGDEFKAHADLCIHCKLCRTECPIGRRRLELDARSQGGLRREARPAAQRLDLFADRALGAAGEPVSDRDQLPAVAALGALAARPAAGRLAPPAPAAGAAHVVHAPGGPSRLEQAPASAAGPARRLFRRRLRQLLRPGARRSRCRGAPPGRRQCLSCRTASAARAWRP